MWAGADAVYLGYGDFNARRNAKNFSSEELAEAVSYCHERGVKVYLTLNTLLTDRELPAAALDAAEASRAGVDAVLVQDLGLVRALRQAAPDLPIHASTQMTLHNLDGVKFAADLGMTRAVLSRELSGKEISRICANSPIEIEVFVHGALCMCYSGQCFFSSVIGGRSGNRGLCAQPCRLAYGWGDRPDGYPLSLRDMSLAHHLKELQEMGVACAKIEGRMKRPEYVAVVTEVYARALREGRDPTEEDLKRLDAAFSRQGFTDGYFMDQTGPDMFGVRENLPEPKKLFAAVRADYLKNDARRLPVKFYAMVRRGEPLQVGVEDREGRVITAAGAVPEEARTRAVTTQDVEEQLSKTGGTPYQSTGVRALVEPGLAVPLSALNALRRQVLDGLTAKRASDVPPRRTGEFKAGARYENTKIPPRLHVQLSSAGQLTPELCRLKPDLVYLPSWEISANPQVVEDAGKYGVPVAAVLPRICHDDEETALWDDLNRCRELGVTDVLGGDYGLLRFARDRGFTLRGDFGLPVFNSQSIKECKRLGLSSVTASFELKLAQIRDLSKSLDTELIAYGRLPLMITENCIVKNRSGRCSCDNQNQLVDRKNARFPW